MNPNGPPSWVAGRADCRLDFKFEALREIVERDVEEFNGLPQEKRGQKVFKFIPGDEGVHPWFIVEGVGAPGKIKFKLFEDFILVTHGFVPHEESESRIRPAWNAVKRECRLLADDDKQTYEVWEISQRVLEDLFFPS